MKHGISVLIEQIDKIVADHPDWSSGLFSETYSLIDVNQIMGFPDMIFGKHSKLIRHEVVLRRGIVPLKL